MSVTYLYAPPPPPHSLTPACLLLLFVIFTQKDVSSYEVLPKKPTRFYDPHSKLEPIDPLGVPM